MNPLRTRRALHTAALLALTLPLSHAALLWLSPITDQLQVSAYYDLPNGPYQTGHRGIDMPATTGDTVRSPVSGTVTFVGTVANKPVLSIRVDARTVISFEPISSELNIGDTVARGQAIGAVAVGGHCVADCLHLGVRLNDEYVNPLRFFWAKPVLLPW